MDRYHHLVDWSDHPRFREWAEIYKTKAMLLGYPVKSIGWNSLTFGLKNVSYDADTLEVVQWQERYQNRYGAQVFMKWLKENGEETPE
jgi:hypothetical protein